MILLKGADFSASIEKRLAEEIKSLGRKPVLAIVRIGERPDDLAYERGARKRMEKMGMRVRTEAFASGIGNEEFLEAFRAVHIQREPQDERLRLPLPGKF